MCAWIDCAGAGSLHRARRAAEAVRPLVTEPLGAERAQALIDGSFSVSDSRFIVNYYRMTSDHRLLLSSSATSDTTVLQNTLNVRQLRVNLLVLLSSSCHVGFSCALAPIVFPGLGHIQGAL